MDDAEEWGGQGLFVVDAVLSLCLALVVSHCRGPKNIGLLMSLCRRCMFLYLICTVL